MAIRFNANEVFEMAEKAEQNAAAFYRKAAEIHPSPHNKDFLVKLAEMEDIHRKTFAKMREGLSEKEREETAFDPMGEASLYLSAMADQQIAEGSPDRAIELTGKETMEEILHVAIKVEGKSILFYMGIKDLVSDKMGKEKIDHIIAEEKGHVITLTRELENLHSGAR